MLTRGIYVSRFVEKPLLDGGAGTCRLVPDPTRRMSGEESNNATDSSFALCCIVVYTCTAVATNFEAAWQGHLGDDDLAAYGIGESVASYASALDFMWLGVLARVSRCATCDGFQAASTLKMGWITSVALGLVLTVAVEIATQPILQQFGPSPRVLAIATPYLRVHVCGLIPLELYSCSVAALQGLQHTSLWSVLMLAVAGTLLASNDLAVVVLRGGTFSSGVASATRNTLFALLSCGLFFACGAGKRRQVGSLLWKCSPSAQEWRVFLVDSLVLFVAGIGDKTQTVLFSAFTSRLGAVDASAMVIVKQVMTYPNMLSKALVVASTRLTAASVGAQQQQQQQQEQRRHPALRPLQWLCIGTALLGLGIVLCFQLGAKAIFEAFSAEQDVLALLQEQEWLMCALACSNLASGVASGLVYGLHQFGWLSCVTLSALGGVFVPILVYGLHAERGLTLQLLLGGNLAYTCAACLGNIAVLACAKPRVAPRTPEVEDPESGHEQQPAAADIKRAAEQCGTDQQKPLLPRASRERP